MKAFLADFIELLNKVADDPGKSLEDYGGWNVDNVNEQTQSSPVTPLPMVLCGSFVLEPMEEVIGYWSTEVELGIALSFAPYNQVFQQLLDKDSLLNQNTGINALFIRLDDWVRVQKDLPIQQQIKLFNQTHSEFASALEQFRQHSKVPCLISIVPLLDPAAFSPEVVAYIDQLNNELQSLVEKKPGFHLIDLELVAGLYSIEDVYDARSDEYGHMPFTQEFYAALGTYLARKVNAFKGPAYKVLALDCDNTLWKGICGELGATGVIIDENFQQLQDFFIKKYQEGFLLVLASKNNEADVWDVFDRHPGMKLKREHIAAHRINWEPKSGNIASIARELNLGVGSFIFLDDSEFEIGEVSAQLPDVLAIALPADDTDYESFLQHIWAFDYFHVTEEDTRRNELYKVEKERRDEADNFSSVTEFLNSLNIQVNILPLSESNLERAVQLTLRTNQFNLNGIRKTAEEIARRLQDENALNWVIEVRDRFGEYGIVGLVLANRVDRTLAVETFLLSCRVLGRNVEDQVLASLLAHCDKEQLESVTANYIATTKNKPFGDFLVRTAWQAEPQANTYYRTLKNIEQTIAG
jgi:FkbH-like protein